MSLGIPFLKRSLRSKARAGVAFLNGLARRRHGPCFSPLATNGLCFAAPASLSERRSRQSAVQPSCRLGMRNGIS